MLIRLREIEVQVFIFYVHFCLVFHSGKGESETASTPTGSTGSGPGPGPGRKGGRLSPVILRGWNNPSSKANNWGLLKIEEDLVGQEVEDKIQALEKSHCDHAFVHCYDFWKSRHNRLKQMKLEDKCFRLVKGYVFCPYFSREDASKAKENVDKENQALQTKEKTELEDTS